MRDKRQALLVDFKPGLFGLRTEDAIAELASVEAALQDRYEIVHATTAWNGGSAPLDFADADVIFVNATYGDDTSSTLHAYDHETLKALIEKGSAAFVFVGGCRHFHLDNLTGVPIDFKSNDCPPTACKLLPGTPFTALFAKLGNRIEIANVLIDRHGGPSELFLVNSKGWSTGFFIAIGRGLCAFLPSFGDSAPQAIRVILEEVLPRLCPHLIYVDKLVWLEQDDYLFPTLLELRGRQQRARTEYEVHDSQLKAEYDSQHAEVQLPWNQLLISSGDELKRAVKNALESFGFNVADVDEHLVAKGVSIHEEDLWVADGSQPDPSIAGVVLAEVKSSERGTTKEDDYAQLIKYLNRRKKSCNNVDLRGLLVINHAYSLPAKIRPKAFSEAIIRDSMADDVTLATSWDLFRLGQRLLGGEISSEKIRALFKSPGELQLP